MWIRHQVEGNGVRYIGSRSEDVNHPITGEPIDVTDLSTFMWRDAFDEAKGYWVGKIGKDEFIIYDE